MEETFESVESVLEKLKTAFETTESFGTKLEGKVLDLFDDENIQFNFFTSRADKRRFKAIFEGISESIKPSPKTEETKFGDGRIRNIILNREQARALCNVDKEELKETILKKLKKLASSLESEVSKEHSQRRGHLHNVALWESLDNIKKRIVAFNKDQEFNIESFTKIENDFTTLLSKIKKDPIASLIDKFKESFGENVFTVREDFDSHTDDKVAVCIACYSGNENVLSAMRETMKTLGIQITGSEGIQLDTNNTQKFREKYDEIIKNTLKKIATPLIEEFNAIINAIKSRYFDPFQDNNRMSEFSPKIQQLKDRIDALETASQAGKCSISGLIQMKSELKNLLNEISKLNEKLSADTATEKSHTDSNNNDTQIYKERMSAFHQPPSRTVDTFIKITFINTCDVDVDKLKKQFIGSTKGEFSLLELNDAITSPSEGNSPTLSIKNADLGRAFSEFLIKQLKDGVSVEVLSADNADYQPTRPGNS